MKYCLCYEFSKVGTFFWLTNAYVSRMTSLSISDTKWFFLQDITYYNQCSIVFGMAVLLVWIGLLRFLTYLKAYNVRIFVCAIYCLIRVFQPLFCQNIWNMCKFRLFFSCFIVITVETRIKEVVFIRTLRLKFGF